MQHTLWGLVSRSFQALVVSSAQILLLDILGYRHCVRCIFHNISIYLPRHQYNLPLHQYNLPRHQYSSTTSVFFHDISIRLNLCTCSGTSASRNLSCPVCTLCATTSITTYFQFVACILFLLCITMRVLHVESIL